MRASRPFSVTLFVLLVLIFSVFKLARFVQVIQNWHWLVEMLSVLLIYLALNGLMWAIVGFISVGVLWFGVSWAPRFTWTALIIYSINYWLEYIFLVDRTERNLNWPFVLVFNLVLLACSIWVLTRSKAKKFFGE